MASALKRAGAKLLRRRIRARLLIEPPKPVTEGWLVRLRCQNPGTPGTFAGAVVAIDGRPPLPVDGPLVLAWRGDTGSRPLPLPTRHGELLRVAVFQTGTRPTWTLLGAADVGGPEVRHVCPGQGEITLDVVIRRGDEIEIRRRVVLSSRANDRGDFVPIVTFGS